MPVTKVIEVIGSSPSGSDDAVREAFDAASRSIRGISQIDIVSVSAVVEDGAIVRWDATVKVQFPVEPR